MLFFATVSLAQQGSDGKNQTNPEATPEQLNAIKNTPAKTGLTYSSLSQFIQSTVTSGKNGGFSFKSSFFGLAYLFNGKNDSLSRYYLSKTGKWQRNQELSLGINKTGSGNDQISLVTVGYKVSVINNRDKSEHNFFEDKVLSSGIDVADHSMAIADVIYTSDVAVRFVKSNFSGADLNNVLTAVDAERKAKLANIQSAKWTTDDLEKAITASKVAFSKQELTNLKNKFNEELKKGDGMIKAYTSADSSNKPADYKRFKAIADSIFKKYGYSYSELHKNLQKEYNAYAKKIETGALLTLSFNPGYNFQYNHFDTTSFSARYLKGFGNYKKPWNVDLQGTIVSLRDSSSAPKDFGHNKGKISVGLNKVFAVDDKDNPLLESEFAGEYDLVLNGRYAHEQKQVVTANLVTSIHLSKEFTLPLTLKYDIKHPNVFGFISLQWNLEDSGKSNSKTN
jgi:hypothetical protein